MKIDVHREHYDCMHIDILFQSTFCSDVISDDGSTAVSANTYCGDDAEGYMEVCEDGDYYYILISGAPDHDAEYDQVITNPNERCKLTNKSYLFRYVELGN